MRSSSKYARRLWPRKARKADGLRRRWYKSSRPAGAGAHGQTRAAVRPQSVNMAAAELAGS
nr:MAG TPA: hypothetical protein [Caudoviricetes sp.]